MKNNRYLFILLILCLNGVSCQKWLDVQPKTEIKQDKLFDSESGFKDALMGVYVLLGDEQLYGKELTIGMLDVIAGQYELLEENSYSQYTKYNYPTNSIFDEIWNKSYQAIANINAILDEIDRKANILHPTNHAIIKGEALGLRAFLHFDLLRMYGWGNIDEKKEAVLNRLSIPYVKKYHKSLTKQSTVGEVLKQIEEDLLAAEQLLGNYDPKSPLAKPENYELPDDDGFYKNRIARFNYWAVNATLARVYMWGADYKNALKYAVKFTDGSKPFQWVDPNSTIFIEAKFRDYKLLTENVFTLTCHRLYESIKPNVEQFEIHGTHSTIENTEYFFFSEGYLNQLYETASGVGLSDWRQMTYFNNEKSQITYRKFYEITGGVGANKVPLIRISEMFYYAAECYWRAGESKKAIDLINEVRNSRGIAYERNIPYDVAEVKIFEEIMKEWKKEYISEGVMFYLYKRLNYAIPKATKTGDEVFVFPLPKVEIETGGREDNVEREN